MIKKISQAGIVFSLLSAPVLAQQSAWQEIHTACKAGVELFERGKYTSAAKQLDRFEELQNASTLQLDEVKELSLMKENARYYQAICALELGETNAEAQFLKFILSVAGLI